MAYSSYGKKVYSSIKDLPQYTSIGNGDKIIVWNETRDGAAVVDFADLVIDLEHCSFKSTISEMITLASDIQVFVNTVSDEITNIQDTLKNVEDAINNELRCRIKALEFIIAVMLGSNSYWLSDGGLDLLKNQFFISGIKPADNADLSTAESDEQKNTIKWFTGLINTIQKYIAKVDDGVQESHILLQSKYRYKYNDVMVPVTAAAPATLSRTTTITNYNVTANGDVPTTKTTIEQ